MTTTDDPLVSTDWLAAHLDDPNVKVIDASFKMPGVLPLPNGRLSRRAYSGRGVLRCRRGVRSFQSAAAHVSRRRAVRRATSARSASPMAIPSWLYDSGGWVAAPRAWWMFLSFGHRNVKVLNGGLKKWVAEGRPVETGKVTPKPAKVQGQARSAATSQHAATARQSRDPRRAGDRCARRASASRARSPSRGRAFAPAISPAAATCPTTNLFDAETGTMKPLDDLRQAFSGAGVELTKPIVTSCGSGVSRRGADAGALSPRRARHRAV